MKGLKLLAFCILLVFLRTGESRGQNRELSTTVTGGRGLLIMQSARTLGEGNLVIGIKGLSMKKESRILSSPGVYYDKTDNPFVSAVPVSLGLTDEIDLTAAFFAFHDARSLKDSRDFDAGYGIPEQGIGASYFGVKIRLPLSPQSRFQIAGKFGASMDTSNREMDGMNYFWTRIGTSIESSIYESFDLTPSFSLNLEQGYAISGSRIYDDQVVGAVGLQFHIRDRVALSLELNNRTFLGVSPQSAPWAAASPETFDSSTKKTDAASPAFMRDSRADFERDYLVLSPSVALRINRYVSLDFGANINLADQASPREKYQVVGGITFNTDLRSLIDSDGDGVRNDVDMEKHTPKGFPVNKSGIARDSDNDGVPDGRDLQPDTPRGARIDALGVGFDSDGDGVYDGLDEEPQTPYLAPVDRFGVALDDDRDGIPNDRDLEPKSLWGAVVTRTGQSRDGDGDGVPDGIDMEPRTPRGAMVNASGASIDGDGDGVPDGIDEEANTPKGVLVDRKGRALIRQEVNLPHDGFIRLNTLYFESGNIFPNRESWTVVDEIGRLLLKYPALNIQIEGHTDAGGTPETNYRISRERAKSVLDYLMKRFPQLDRRRFRVVGYGADKPAANNSTPEGRKANRRVDFVIINQGESLIPPRQP